MKQDQDSKSRGDDKLGEGAPSDDAARKMGLKIGQFIKAFLDDLKIAWVNSFKSASIEPTDDANSHFLSRFLKREIQNTRMFWASLMTSSKRVLIGLAVTYVLLVSLFTGESSNGTSSSFQKVEFVHYSDNSCTPRTDRRCVSKEEFQSICRKTSGWDPVVFQHIGVTDGFVSTLETNHGEKAFKNGSVYISRAGTCVFKFDAVGLIRGNSYNRTYYCPVTSIEGYGLDKSFGFSVKSVAMQCSN